VVFADGRLVPGALQAAGFGSARGAPSFLDASQNGALDDLSALAGERISASDAHALQDRAGFARSAAFRTELERILLQLRRDLGDASESEAQKIDQAVSTAEGIAVVVSTGLLVGLARAGSLSALAVSSLPLWQRMDPLVILALSPEERERLNREMRATREDEARIEDGVERLFGEGPAGSL
jgi:hypothetical protein